MVIDWKSCAPKVCVVWACPPIHIGGTLTRHHPEASLHSRRRCKNRCILSGNKRLKRRSSSQSSAHKPIGGLAVFQDLIVDETLNPSGLAEAMVTRSATRLVRSNFPMPSLLLMTPRVGRICSAGMSFASGKKNAFMDLEHHLQAFRRKFTPTMVIRTPLHCDNQLIGTISGFTNLWTQEFSAPPPFNTRHHANDACSVHFCFHGGKPNHHRIIESHEHAMCSKYVAGDAAFATRYWHDVRKHL